MTEQPSEPIFPLAEIADKRSTSGLLVRLSRLWWLTLFCFLLAVYLAWKSLPATGPVIVIHFPEGHGLKAGDSLRHRGIEVGIVGDVSLKQDLSAITATVTLAPEAADLACEGTRFWIVRPQLNLITGVSGLETAVGSKYIAVSPGEQSAEAVAGKTIRRRSVFEGLASVPPDEVAGDGIDIILRSDQKYGISIGSPLTWRGVDVGKILSVNLSPDARFVDVHARVDESFRRLLRGNSKFWVNSGMGVDFGLSGVRFNADSLTTIIRGGVAFATPADSAVGAQDADAGAGRIQAGHIFALHRQPEPGWLTAETSIPLIDVALPQTITVHGSRKTTLLGIPRNQAFTHNGILLPRTAGTMLLLTAADGIAETSVEKPSTDSEAVEPISLTVKSPVLPEAVALEIQSSELIANTAGIAALSVPQPDISWPTNAMVQLRASRAPEECCLARTVRMNGKETSVIQSIGRHQLEALDGYWKVSLDATDLKAWHGAPVVAMSDGKVLGLFLASKLGPVIVPLTEEIVQLRTAQK